jgi:SPP1 gp7 family putative phage head morphogenesis protein
VATRNLATNSRRAQEAAEDIVRFTSGELERSYRRALDDIRAEISRLYELYMAEGELTKAQATQFLRNSGIERRIVNIMSPVLTESEETLRQTAQVAFDRSFFKHAWAIDQASGVNLGWGSFSDAAVRAAVGIGDYTDDLRGLLSEKEVARHARVLNNAFSNYESDTRRWISRQVRDGIIKGESVDKLAKRLDKQALMHSKNSAITIARTETLRATGIGGQIGYDEAREKGVNIREMWDATLDSRTRPDHAAADGAVKDNESGLFSVPWGTSPGPRRNGIAAQDINCRCTAVGEVEGYSPEVRRIRGEGVQPYQTFGEWARRNGITANRYGQKYDRFFE